MQPSTVNSEEETPEWFAHGPVGGPRRVNYHPAGHNPHQHTARQPHLGAQGQQKPTQQRAMHAHCQQNLDPVAPLRHEKPIPSGVVTMSQHAELPVEEKKLSKAAKAKLRKKMREGKI